jgi:arylsulfatase A-like enzyme
MMMKVPEGTAGLPKGSKDGSRCDRITSLMDIYPTLIDLCGLPGKADLDGRSLVPLLRNPSAPWDYPALTTYDYSEFSVRTEEWRYTRYIDDSEELYDHRSDSEEWTNLADNPDFAHIKRQMAAHIPTELAPVKDTSYKLEPHHLPPFKSKEEYLRKKAAEKK